MRRTRRRESDSREYGAAYLEMSISIFFFTMLAILTTDVVRMAYQLSNAQHIVNQAIREIVIGPHQTTATARLADVKTRVKNISLKTGIVLEDANIVVCSISTDPSCAQESGGDGGDLVSISIDYPFSFAFWAFTTSIQASAVGRNEPFGRITAP